MISTRGRYALRVLIDLAEQGGEGYVAMKDIAVRQAVSVKYLERILSELTKADLLQGASGKGGGYRLVKAPQEYRVGDILRITEGDLAPVACLCADAEPCARTSQCRTVAMWREYARLTNAYFDGITLADLMKQDA